MVKISIGRTRIQNIATLLVVLVGIILISLALRNIYVGNRGYSEAKDEYDMLRERFEHIANPQNTGEASIGDPAGITLPQHQACVFSTQNPGGIIQSMYQFAPMAFIQAPRLGLPGAPNAFRAIIAGSASATAAPSSVSPSGRSMFKHFHNMPDPDAPPGPKDINPDYVGWISIPGINISFPVVRGADNEKYMDITFSGAKNSSGSIYMDYRCKKNFSSPVTIIYGHSMNDGSMFAPIRKYQDFNYIVQYPIINITTEKDEILSYRIFDAKRVGAYDKVFALDIQKAVEPGYFTGAPEDAGKFLVLSTCIGFKQNDERMLVYAALEG